MAISQNLFYLYFSGQHARALNRIDSTLSYISKSNPMALVEILGLDNLSLANWFLRQGSEWTDLTHMWDPGPTFIKRICFYFLVRFE